MSTGKLKTIPEPGTIRLAGDAEITRAKFAINDRVKIVRDGKTIFGKIDEILLFRRENKIGYRVLDKSDWSWWYVGEEEVTKA